MKKLLSLLLFASALCGVGFAISCKTTQDSRLKKSTSTAQKTVNRIYLAYEDGSSLRSNQTNTIKSGEKGFSSEKWLSVVFCENEPEDLSETSLLERITPQDFGLIKSLDSNSKLVRTKTGRISDCSLVAGIGPVNLVASIDRVNSTFKTELKKMFANRNTTYGIALYSGFGLILSPMLVGSLISQGIAPALNDLVNGQSHEALQTILQIDRLNAFGYGVSFVFTQVGKFMGGASLVKLLKNLRRKGNVKKIGFDGVEARIDEIFNQLLKENPSLSYVDPKNLSERDIKVLDGLMYQFATRFNASLAKPIFAEKPTMEQVNQYREMGKAELIEFFEGKKVSEKQFRIKKLFCSHNNKMRDIEIDWKHDKVWRFEISKVFDLPSDTVNNSALEMFLIEKKKDIKIQDGDKELTRIQKEWIYFNPQNNMAYLHYVGKITTENPLVCNAFKF